jgi:hypothetical protein
LLRVEKDKKITNKVLVLENNVLGYPSKEKLQYILY